MNPYLKAKRTQYEALKASIEGIHNRASEHDNGDGTKGRALSDQEATLVREQNTSAQALFEEIEELTKIEQRNRRMEELAGDMLTNDERARSLGGGTSGTTAKDRDPGHYRSAAAGGQHSFFGDLYRSKVNKDEVAGQRLTEHMRALDTGGEGVGIVPPKWLTDEFETLARQGRRIANAVRNIPLGDDPRPITLPRQTAGTDAVVAEQVNENDPVDGTDAWDSDVHVVSPKPTAGKQTVSRQMIDMSTPAVDLLIYGDLIEVYDDKVETKVASAIVTAAGAALGTFANEAAFEASNGGAAYDAAIDLQIAVRQARKRPADLMWMSVRRYGEHLKLKDSTGRPLVPGDSGGAMNVMGVGEVAVDGRFAGLGIIASDGFGTTAYPESYGVMKASDTVLFESNLLRFRFEEVAGPESIVLGIWGYTGVIVRQTPGAVGTQSKSVRRQVITAAV